jgi:formate hydrogenlyase subunit 6/NADH:ubiquinone oxidoreductase subunit I
MCGIAGIRREFGQGYRAVKSCFFLQIILCSVPWVEICPSDAISLSEILSFIQVKQNKISWDKFLQIPANFEIISQQILDWNIPRITPNTIKI